MGILRLFLAMCVVSQHFNQPFGVKLLDAGMAVYLFFIISGFYMAMILNEKYIEHGSNSTFWWNRALRLWPAYAISIAIVVLAGLYSGAMGAYRDQLAAQPWPYAVLIMLSQLTGIGQDLFAHVSFTPDGIRFAPYGIDPSNNGMSFLLNLPAWSISIEMLFYLLAPFFVRSLRGAFALFSVGIAYCFLAPEWMPTGHRLDLYFPFTCVFFGLGALAYWMKRSLSLGQFGTAAAIACTCCAVLTAPMLQYPYLIATLSVPLLFAVTRRNRIDAFLGDLSYPVYILQIPVAQMILAFGYGGHSLFGVAAIIVVSVAVVLLVERPIDRLRQANARAVSWCVGTPLDALARRSSVLHAELPNVVAGDLGVPPHDCR